MPNQRDPSLPVAIVLWLVLACGAGALGGGAAVLVEGLLAEKELRELWVLVAVGAWLALACGAAVLGASVGAAIAVLQRSWWLAIVLALVGLLLGVVVGTLYSDTATFPAVAGSRARGIWVASSRLGLWLGLAGSLVFVVAIGVRLVWGRRQGATGETASR